MHEIETLYLKVRLHKVKMVNSILKDWAGAEDVVQEAFLRAWLYYPSFDPSRASLETWFNSILFNSLRDYQRMERGDSLNHNKDVSVDDLLSDINPRKGVIAAKIDKVENEKHKRVLELFFLLGYTSTEISQIEHRVTVSNVTTIVKRFRDEVAAKKQ